MARKRSGFLQIANTVFESDLVRSVIRAICQSSNDHPMVFL